MRLWRLKPIHSSICLLAPSIIPQHCNYLKRSSATKDVRRTVAACGLVASTALVDRQRTRPTACRLPVSSASRRAQIVVRSSCSVDLGSARLFDIDIAQAIGKPYLPSTILDEPSWIAESTMPASPSGYLHKCLLCGLATPNKSVVHQ